MTGESIECFNCGRQNPGWAQICRSCGVRIDPSLARGGRPAGLFPTDQRSLVAMAAALGTIVLGILVALFLSGLDPFDPSVARASPTPDVEPSPSSSFEPEVVPSASVPLVASATPAAVPTGTITFGTGIDTNGAATGVTDTFAPNDFFAHSISVPEPFGVAEIGEQVVEMLADGTEQEVVAASDNTLDVDPATTVKGVICCAASELTSQLGPGQYILRAYAGETLIAEAPFRLSEG